MWKVLQGLLRQYKTPFLNVSRNKHVDCDLIVIGGGSGGLSAAKTAASYGKSVAIFDYVKPTIHGTTWGIGGTCLNVGCIPKKLMHHAALLRLSVDDAVAFGWKVDPPKITSHDWATLVGRIQKYIRSANFSFRVDLQQTGIKYINAHAKFMDKYTVGYMDAKTKKERKMSAPYIIIAVGGRPKFLDNTPGGAESDGLCISSDDLFSLKHPPGKTLCIGASYISLECAGFLSGLGVDTTVLARGGLLGRFDREIADKIGVIMKERGTQILQGYNLKAIKLKKDGEPRELSVTIENSTSGNTIDIVFNTVLLAVGREPSLSCLQLEKAGIRTNKKSKKIIANRRDGTSASNVYAIGDCVHGRPELTPSAIRAGYLLSQRLFSGSLTKVVNYNLVPTTIFTPVEYRCVGVTEEDAVRTHGARKIEVFHTKSRPLEFVLNSKRGETCFAKLITLNTATQQTVIGFHYLGPNAGEITQGFALAMLFGASKADFDACIGIHPTCAELFTTLTITKSSGNVVKSTGC